MTSVPPVPAQFFPSKSDLRAWFEAHHTDTAKLWVGFYKAHTGRSGVVYSEAVDEALCFGWIDTTVRRIDDDRYANRFTPRRPNSGWSTVNLRRFAELERAGRVRDAGRRAFERRPRARIRPEYSSGRTFRLAPAFAARLKKSSAAERFFRSRNRGYRNRAAFWVMSAARPETRERRFAALLDACSTDTIPPALLLPGELAPRPAARPARRAGGVRAPRPPHRQKPSGRG
ncbi:MAG TPA: YdeI/OmpD-associated family protein [Thermoplasmata archaeon]|nr:YdeI/OmpD-associated family protein [Thermoplasmata archaeon]HYB79034.1 YdeI/OmpD-associated family protein [Thermoplasmata archaeon]